MIVKDIKVEVAGIQIVDGKRLVSSYSQIDKFLQCPYSWYLKYILKLPQGEKAKALDYGLAIHETKEHFFVARMVGINLSENDMLSFYHKAFHDHDIPFDSSEEKLEYYKEGQTAVKRLFNPVNEVEKLMVDPNMTILGVEEYFEVEIELPKPVMAIVGVDEYGEVIRQEYDKVVIIGYIDLILKDEQGRVYVIDHKSGKKVFDKKKLEENLQFPIYAMALKEKYGVLPYQSWYNFTKVHTGQVIKQEAEGEKDVTLDDKRLVESKKEIIKVFKKMAGAKHTAKPSFLCYWCDYSKHKKNNCERSSDFKPKTAK